jgi:hypothetical protein
MGPYAGVDYNLTLCPLQSRLQQIYYGLGQPYARVDLNPICQSQLYPPVRDFGFSLWGTNVYKRCVGREIMEVCMFHNLGGRDHRTLQPERMILLILLGKTCSSPAL